ncbi:MAG: hypothetical protein KJ970_01390 [Candidatus Eisenbacteria bacterium]|uniref:Uncharacterized protein n=1 Tax=Eiseniibacteriota bacterium TaxID=2212470 RepID=A0A948RS22_UNCEI|nr:hypothetical protein [Candidatus Eisenbacteria bacterium]MBU1950371.1 hypothetical protein [Candidatus Eisenbacteria bacterium]MBU2689556.1 hypothetical protein [Candidatus Eisenbacteria bacterium]
MFELITIGVIGLALVAYFTIRRTPQVASERQSRSFSGSILGAPEEMSSERCSRCHFGESTGNAREVWCRKKKSTVFWNASCEQFEGDAPAVCCATGGRESA